MWKHRDSIVLWKDVENEKQGKHRNKKNLKRMKSNNVFNSIKNDYY